MGNVNVCCLEMAFMSLSTIRIYSIILANYSDISGVYYGVHSTLYNMPPNSGELRGLNGERTKCDTKQVDAPLELWKRTPHICKCKCSQHYGAHIFACASNTRLPFTYSMHGVRDAAELAVVFVLAHSARNTHS